MDKSWLAAARWLKEYEVEVEIFLKFASNPAKNLEYMHCPYRKRGNMNFELIKDCFNYMYKRRIEIS